MIQNECPVHPRAARCFHRGNAWVAEYVYQNGHWKLDISNPDDHHVRAQHTSDECPEKLYRDRLYERQIAYLRGEETTIGVLDGRHIVFERGKGATTVVIE